MKSIGGVAGECVECDRHWHPGEGMPTACTDRFSVREKASALVKLAEGASYRHASQQARIRAQPFQQGPNGALTASRDGRLAADWVSQRARGFHVFAALSYGDGTVAEAERFTREPMVWRLGVFRVVSQTSWEEFFAQVAGQPTYVVCDRQSGMLNALANVWPGTRVYPCTQTHA